MEKKNHKLIIGIMGGSGSGKTTLARTLQKTFGQQNSCILEQDSFYKDQSHLPPAERNKLNFDHPYAIDFDLLYRVIRQLADGCDASTPTYDFESHTRIAQWEIIPAKPILIIEGFLLFGYNSIRSLMDLRVFIDTDDNLRLSRRLQRDVLERGRTYVSVLDQYYRTVKPMHDEFVSPAKKYAHIIVDGNDNIENICKIIFKRININSVPPGHICSQT
jgi:uridine kinase